MPFGSLSTMRVDFQVETAVGEFAGIDFGGRGPAVLLVSSGSGVCCAGVAETELVGHSTGGYAVTAAVVAGVVEPAGVCVLGGFVPDARVVVRQATADTDWPALADQLRGMFRYGWVADDDELAAYVEQVVAEADRDWLNAGVDPDVAQPLTLALATVGSTPASATGSRQSRPAARTACTWKWPAATTFTCSALKLPPWY